jgi:hypothetical protein
MTEQDLDYFARRMREEREAAARARNARVAAAHAELERRYAGLVEACRPLLRQAG